jgi:hypothetical protein
MARKPEQLIIVGAILLCLLLLTAGLSNLRLADPGRTSTTLYLLNPDGSINPMPFVFVGLFMFFLIVLVLWRKINRKGIPYGAVLLLLLVAVAWVLIISHAATPAETIMEGLTETPLGEEALIGQQSGAAPVGVAEGETVETMIERQVLAWVSLIISVLMAFLFLATNALLIWLYFHVRPDEVPVEVDQPLTGLAQQAKAAVQALQAGQSFHEVVLRCYADMERVLATTQDIRRKQAMTPREFEGQLIQLGLPAAPVQELTRLFETVRYGRYTPQEAERKRAMDSLLVIVNACEAVSSPAVKGQEDEAIVTISV